MGVQQNGVYWPFKTLLQGAGISISEDATTIRITNTGGSGTTGGGDMLQSEYATNGVAGVVDKAVTAQTVTGTVANATNAQKVPWTGVTGAPTSFPSDWTQITSKPATFAPATHGITHLPTGTDPVPLASATAAGWLAKLSGSSGDYVGGDNACHSLLVASIPVGSIFMFPYLGAPLGWFVCEGAWVSRTAYATLFKAMCGPFSAYTQAGSPYIYPQGAWPEVEYGYPVSGPTIPAGAWIVNANTGAGWIQLNINAVYTANNQPCVVAPWGAGDGSTTFALPDLRGRSPVGWGGATVGLTGREIGQLAGEENHTLVAGEMPYHNHPISTWLADPGHAHTVGGYEFFTNVNPDEGYGRIGLTGNPYTWTSTQGTNMQVASSAGYTGGNGAHNNMHPIACVRYIIKAE